MENIFFSSAMWIPELTVMVIDLILLVGLPIQLYTYHRNKKSN